MAVAGVPRQLKQLFSGATDASAKVSASDVEWCLQDGGLQQERAAADLVAAAAAAAAAGKGCL